MNNLKIQLQVSDLIRFLTENLKQRDQHKYWECG